MNVCQFNKVLYKGNINVDFYLFCLKRDKKLMKYLFINLWYYICSYLFKSKRNIYAKKKFKYLKNVKDINKTLKEFYEVNDIDNYFKIESNVIVDKIPEIFIKSKFKGVKKICYDLDENYEVKLDKFSEEILALENVENLYLSNKYFMSEVVSKYSYLVRNRMMFSLKNRKRINSNKLAFISIIILSIVITCFSFMFTNSDLNIEMFISYFEIRLFILNLLPILAIMILLYMITKRVHWAWLITSLSIFALGISNQTKVFYRDDVVKFEDLTLIKEALIMAEECDVVIKSYTIVFALLIILLYFILKKNIKKLSLSFVKRLILIVLTIILVFLGYKNIYKNKEIYDNVGDTSLINIWIFTRQSQIRGLIYPFIYTLEDGFFVEPDNYDEEKVEEILSQYEYQDIPEDKKVNVIAIMLEAFNDFSKFDVIDFKEDIYRDFHNIQENSISGNLVVNIFGGSTVTTERQFLTGYADFDSLRSKTNSYVWYFKEQGYRTEAMHPIYGAFYNRASINPNLGFDIYYNYENKYSKIQSNFVNDDLFFDSIIEGYENSKKEGLPYFNFSVTYQNHVPYSNKTYDGKEYYFDNNGMDESLYNEINEYFSGIKKTNGALKKLIEYFDNEEEATIIILFGDHNPALGDNALGYHELGINISLDEVEGFLNYYETPYVIHANDSAREMFDNSFVGDGGNISPIFLMNKVFKNMKLSGNEYLQYMSSLKNSVDVITSTYYKEDEQYVRVSDSKYFDLIEQYKWVNYYQLDK